MSASTGSPESAATDPVAAELPAPGGDELMTIDALAGRTGMTVRTVRFYAAEGLLPPPVRQGRIAYYGLAHRLRLEFIRELQDFGYTLAGVQRCLARIPADASANDLAMHRALLAPWGPERACEFGPAELERRAGRRLSERDLDFLVSIGTITRVGGPSAVAFRTTPASLAMGVDLLDLPVPMDVLREAAAVIEVHAAAAAEGLSEVFRAGVWEPYRRGDAEAVDQQQLATVVSRLRPIAVQGLVAAFERAADRAIRRPGL